MGVPSLKDLAVDGTLNTTNQLNLKPHVRFVVKYYFLNGALAGFCPNNNGYILAVGAYRVLTKQTIYIYVYFDNELQNSMDIKRMNVHMWQVTS